MPPPTEGIPQWDQPDRLAKALRYADVGVQVMADYLGVSRNTVGNYLHGRTVPDKRTLRLWAMRCEVPLQWLEEGAGDDCPGQRRARRRRHSALV